MEPRRSLCPLRPLVRLPSRGLAPRLIAALVLVGTCGDGGRPPVDAGGDAGTAAAPVDAQPMSDAGDGLRDGAVAEAMGAEVQPDACLPIDSTLGDLEELPVWPPAVAHGIESLPASTTCRAPARPTGAVDDPFPRTLAATGCFEPSDLRKAVPGAIPYGVNAALWSDGADKHRWLVLPPGGKITVRADGDFELPVGTVLLKSFALLGQMLETRFLIRHDDGEWAGYTYVWDEDGGNSATLLGEESASRFVGDVEWIFPSRAACLSCHTAAAGRSLGLEVGQQNGDFVYPDNRRANQLATFAHLDLFSAPIGDPATLPRFARPGLAATGSLEVRARAYLHANCAHCHRPAGLPGASDPPELDLRYAVPLAEMLIVDRQPRKGSFGIPDARLLKPGSALQSILSLRMRTTIANVRMPAIGSTVVDPAGVRLIDAWIDSLGACAAHEP